MKTMLAIAALMLLAFPRWADAQQSPPAGEAVKAVAGAWEMSNAERDRSCVVTLRAAIGPSPGAVSWEEKCAELFPFARNVTNWSVGEREAIRLLDAKGQMVLELSEVEGGLYEGERRGEGLVFLQSVAAGTEEPRKPETAAGDWAFITGNGRTVCRISLTMTPQGEALALKVKPGCGAPISGFGPVSWRLERGELVIIPANGDAWRFEEIDASTWQRVPQLRQPLRLVKQ